MGASSSSYQLDKPCTALDTRYHHCYKLFFENRLFPHPEQVVPTDPNDPESVAAAVRASTRIVYRDGVVVTDPDDIALAIDVVNESSPNYACRDLWEDYKECVNAVWDQKRAAYLERKAAKQKPENK